jgi:putative hydrolase of the HAD superfamily
MIKHIIFDFGGVILDLGGQKTGIPDELASIFQLPVEDVAIVWEKNKTNLLTGKETPLEFLTFFIQEFKLTHNPEDSLRRWEELNILSKERIDWNLLKFIEELKPHYQIHMLTDQIDVNNGPAQWKIEIEDLFHTIFRSYIEGYRKPDHEAYKNLLQKIGAKPEECVFIDDSEKNIQAGESLGIRGLLYSYGNLSELIHQLDLMGIKK